MVWHRSLTAKKCCLLNFSNYTPVTQLEEVAVLETVYVWVRVPPGVFSTRSCGGIGRRDRLKIDFLWVRVPPGV